MESLEIIIGLVVSIVTITGPIIGVLIYLIKALNARLDSKLEAQDTKIEAILVEVGYQREEVKTLREEVKTLREELKDESKERKAESKETQKLIQALIWEVATTKAYIMGPEALKESKVSQQGAEVVGIDTRIREAKNPETTEDEEPKAAHG